MKKIVYLLFLFSFIYADLTDLPTEKSSTNLINTDEVSVSTTTNKDYNTKIKNTKIDSTTGEVISKDINLSSSNPMEYGNKQVDKIFNNLKNTNTLSKSSSIVNNMPGNKDFMKNPEMVTHDYIRNHNDSNSTVVNVLDIVKNVNDNAIARFLKKQEKVKCYISRKLVNAYYCPLSNRDESYYIGGSIKNDKNNAQIKCNRDCRNPLSVFVKDTNYPLSKTYSINKYVYKGIKVTLPLNSKQQFQDVVLTFFVNNKKTTIKPEKDSNSIFMLPVINYDFITTVTPNKNSFDIIFNKTDTNYYYFKFSKKKVSIFNSLNKEPIISANIPTIQNKKIKLELKNNNGEITLFINNIPYVNKKLNLQKRSSYIKIPFKTSNSTYSEINNNRYIKYDVYDENKSLITSQEVKLNSNVIQITQYITFNNNSNKFYLKFYQPYEKDSITKKITTLNNKLVTLYKAKIEYTDNKYYYCANQFVENKSDCNGEIVTLLIGGEPRNICSTLNPGQASNYAYYSEEQAKAKCYETAECLPTYKHLTLNSKVPDWAYDVEVGCVDSEDNKLCKDEICKKLYLSNQSKILEEKTWYGDDKVIETIKGGDIANDRPRVNALAELNPKKDKKELFIEEMKDVAFKHMVNDGTYNFSKDTIAKDYPRQDSIKIINLGMDKNIKWYIKGNSYAYDDKDYYFYVIADIAEQYYNRVFQMLDEMTNTYHDAIDLGVLDRDDVFVLIDNKNNYKVFRKMEFYKRKIPIKDENGTITDIVWQNTKSLKIENKTFKDGEWLAYSLNDKAPYFKKKKFNPDNLYEEFNVFDSVYSTIDSIPGVKIHSQEKDGNNLEKIYTGDEDNTYKSSLLKYKLYGIYSKKPLTYKQIINQINDKNLIFDSEHPHNYTKKINGDGMLDNNVKIYIYGKPGNFSVNGVFNPTPQEEGKKTFIFMFLDDKK